MDPNKPESENPFNVDHGMADEFTFVAKQAYFSTDANYQGGSALLLILDGEDRDTADARKEFWSLGNGFSSIQNGTAVVHEKGKKNFSDVSTIGKVISRILAGLCGEEAKKYFVEGARDPKLASTWEGTVWEMALVEEDTIEKLEDGTRKKRHVRRPVKFLGLMSAAPAPAAAAAVVMPPPPSPGAGALPGGSAVAPVIPPPPAPVAAVAVMPPAVATLPPVAPTEDPLIGTLRLIAQGCPDNATFTTRIPAMAPQAMANPDLMGEILSGALFLRLKAAA